MSPTWDDVEAPAAPLAPPPRADTTEVTPPAPKRRRRLLGWVIVIAIAAVVSIVLRLFVVQTFFVPTGSMEPTLRPYDRILVQKFDFPLQRGEIVVFQHPKRDLQPPLNEDLVKRIIGLPGETIWSVGNTVYIDGKALLEPWLPKGTQLGQAITRQTIPKGEYFMMGDNRSDSYDSRDWGPIPGSTIIGRVFLVIWRNGHPDFVIP